MAATRKLQGEIDRCLKKVAEGVEQFEDIWKKVQNANNTNQKEKYEADLKKEIKKLQRLRDQIKSWITSGEIKDKTVLLQNRKIIETQMERFKVVERETKTKAYSKEGLGASQNRDPAMKERDEQSRWISDRIENLTIQGETIECEIETLHVVGKKKKVDKEKMERIDEKKDWLERHRFHIKKLEILLRMLNNESIEVHQVKSIKDDVDYYVECNQFPDFVENECIYDDINMDELDMATVGKPAVDGEGSTPTPSIGSSPSPASSSVSALPVSNNSTPAVESSKSSTANHSSSNVESGNDQLSTAVSSATTNHTAVITSTTSTTVTPVTGNSTTSNSTSSNVQNNHVERQKRNNKDDSRTPVKPTAVRANVNSSTTNNKGNTPNKGTSQTNNTNAMSYLAASQHNTKNSSKKDVSDHNSSHITSIASSNASNVSNHVHVNSSQNIQQQLLLQQQQQHSNASLNTTDGVATNTSMKPNAQKKMTEVMAQQNQGNAVIASVPSSTRSTTVSTSAANNSNAISVSLPPPTTPVVTSGNNQQQPATGEAHIPPLLGAAPLGTTPLTSEHDIQYKRLQAAFCHMPHPADSERIRSHLPRQSVVTPQHFPQAPPPQSDSVEFFNRLSTETLFFIFYYLEGTKAQYLAAKALKKQSWRFHTKYMMWFQRHEEPKAITDEYEQGTYIFFDYDNWGQRKKENFTFEYRYLEDRDLN